MRWLHFDKPWSVLLVPWRSVDNSVTCSSEGEEGTSHKRADNDLVDSHVGLVSASARRDLNGFLGAVGIVDDTDRVALRVRDIRGSSLHC